MPNTEPPGANGAEYSSYAEAFADTAGHALKPSAAHWLVGELALGWPIWRNELGRGAEARAYPSHNRDLCLMVGASLGEWGQYGPAQYCLVDGSGRILWTADDEVAAPPRVSDTGVTALFSVAKAEAGWHHPGISVSFRDRTGNVVHHRSWTRRVPRPLVRYYPEHYVFVPGSSLFLTTMNVSDRPTLDLGDHETTDFNSTSLFAIDPHGDGERIYELGNFWPQGVEFKTNDVVRFSGDWRSVLWVNPPPTDVGYYDLNVREWTLEKAVTRTIRWEQISE